MAQNVSDPNSWIADHLSGPQQKFVDFAQKVYSEGELDRKTKELIAVATASVGRCPHCTEGHIEGAKEAGASEEEIAEALAVAWAQGSGTQVFWMKGDFDELLGETWREISECKRRGTMSLYIIGRSSATPLQRISHAVIRDNVIRDIADFRASYTSSASASALHIVKRPTTAFALGLYISRSR